MVEPSSSTATPAAHFDAPAGEPGSRRIGNLSAALRRGMLVGRVTTAELAGIVTAVVVALLVAASPVEGIVGAVVVVVVGTILGTEVARRAIARPSRAALEAFGYLGEWELDRAAAMGTGPIASPEDGARWLSEHPERPEERWFRWEVLMLVGRPDEAAAVAERMPEATPYERFERAYAHDRIAWGRGGPSDVTALRALAEAVGPADDDDRRHAEVAVAVAEAQDLASAGLDPLPPLVAARAILPPEIGLGRRYVAGLRAVTFVAAVIAALVVPAAGLLVRTLLGAG